MGPSGEELNSSCFHCSWPENEQGMLTMVANIWLGFFTSTNPRVRIIKYGMTAPIMILFKWELLCWEKLTHHFKNSWCIYQPQPYYWSPIKFTHSVETLLVFIVSHLVSVSWTLTSPWVCLPFGFLFKVFVMEATWKALDSHLQGRNKIEMCSWLPFSLNCAFFFSVRRITQYYSIVFLANKAN